MSHNWAFSLWHLCELSVPVVNEQVCVAAASGQLTTHEASSDTETCLDDSLKREKMNIDLICLFNPAGVKLWGLKAETIVFLYSLNALSWAHVQSGGTKANITQM